MSDRREVTERVVFRLFEMPCCSHLLCWVNPRDPSFCPECGALVVGKMKGCERTHDPHARLTMAR